ncbi:MAG: hypothetical protein U9O66_03035 [Patescibacteria group bacterium]|nr:hypothetical protein [Patescibacteria group bacterium]
MKTLNKQNLFWDVQLKNLNPKKYKKFIIERILLRGDLDDFKWAVFFYGKDKIKEIFLKSKKFDFKSQNFWCFYFNLDKSKCIRKQSIKKQSAFWKR